MKVLEANLFVASDLPEITWIGTNDDAAWVLPRFYEIDELRDSRCSDALIHLEWIRDKLIDSSLALWPHAVLKVSDWCLKRSWLAGPVAEQKPLGLLLVSGGTRRDSFGRYSFKDIVTVVPPFHDVRPGEPLEQ
jgi:hypothetical protein